MAMLMVATELICKERDSLKGTLKFVFQPAEEGMAGAKVMLEDKENNIIEGVDECYGIHLMTNQKVGKIGIATGAISAFSKRFSIKVFFFFFCFFQQLKRKTLIR
jgi:metal-dependent amidase/aminoacylase/carboxypeptidase family protein